MNPSDELGRINEQLRQELWREALASRRQGKRRDQVRFSACVVLACMALAGSFWFGCLVAWIEAWLRGTIP